MEKKPLCWYNIILIPLIHAIGLGGGISYMIFIQFSWATIMLALTWFVFCGLSITGGYHRLFTHKSYEALWPVRLFFLMFGAASAQGSVEQWVSTHRQHHVADRPDSGVEDPHDIKRGFWYAHIGWLFWKMPEVNDRYVAHLRQDPLAQWQTKHYGGMMVFWGFVLPGFIAMSWGDAAGGLLVAGFLRTVVQWHITWCINSVSHYFGENTFMRPDQSRNNYWYAKMLISLGEAYHSFHHEFEWDYRNGWKWWHLDPTKWVIAALNKVGLTTGLKAASPKAVNDALQKAQKR